MFQRAPPEVNGFGVITSTPGLMRSSQVLMSFGLPLRTTKTTTESVTMPLYSSWFQSSATSPASTRRVMSRLEREGDDVGRQAGLDRPALLARGAVGLLERRRPCPAGVFWNAGMSRLVGLLRRRVGDEGEFPAARIAPAALLGPPQADATRRTNDAKCPRFPKVASHVPPISTNIVRKIAKIVGQTIWFPHVKLERTGLRCGLHAEPITRPEPSWRSR